MKGVERITEILRRAKKHYYLLTSALMFLSFPSYDVWFLKGFSFFAWFSLVPLFMYVRKQGYKEIVFSSFIVFLFGNFFTYQWIGNFGAEVRGGYAIILLFLIPSLTVFMVTKVLLAEYLSRTFYSLRPFIYASVWIFIDWIQSLGFLAFPWTYWGYSQYPFTPFIQIAKITGVMGVTFAVVCMNAIVADAMVDVLQLKEEKKLAVVKIFNEKSIRVCAIGFIFILSIAIINSIIMPQRSADRKDFRVAMVQTCIDPWDNWRRNRMSYLAELERETRRAAVHLPDMIIWSESATLETFSYDFTQGMFNEFELHVLNLAKELQIPILTGEIGRLNDYIRQAVHLFNNAVLISKEGKVVQWYSKINLVPFGEWFPYEQWFPWVKEIIDRFGASSFTPGSELVLFEVDGRKFGVLICYEGIFFRHVRRYAMRGVDFMVNITNDGWTDTYNGHMQHFAASVFRAIENGKWFVRAGNTGYSTVIDPYGRTVSKMPILTKGFVVGDMDFRINHQTLYSKIGDAFAYAIFAILGLMTIASFIKKLQGNFGGKQ
ncbi:MAG: apolipoprotein N-acyltransferase [Spirochaetes bacterium]|nr:apolipoprotein N-acyltransferase [Spirochaetota bacterium]